MTREDIGQIGVAGLRSRRRPSNTGRDKTAEGQAVEYRLEVEVAREATADRRTTHRMACRSVTCLYSGGKDGGNGGG